MNESILRLTFLAQLIQSEEAEWPEIKSQLKHELKRDTRAIFKAADNYMRTMERLSEEAIKQKIPGATPDILDAIMDDNIAQRHVINRLMGMDAAEANEVIDFINHKFDSK